MAKSNKDLRAQVEKAITKAGGAGKWAAQATDKQRKDGKRR
jgi:hypothetical protein